MCRTIKNFSFGVCLCYFPDMLSTSKCSTRVSHMLLKQYLIKLECACSIHWHAKNVCQTRSKRIHGTCYTVQVELIQVLLLTYVEFYIFVNMRGARLAYSLMYDCYLRLGIKLFIIHVCFDMYVLCMLPWKACFESVFTS